MRRHDVPGRLVLRAVAGSLIALLALASARAEEIYRCIGPGGVPEYRNNGRVKDCRRLALPGMAPPPGLRGQSAASASSASARGDFPRVDSALQQRRDSERRRLLETELSDEARKLQALRDRYNQGQPERQGDERNYQKYLDRGERLRTEIERGEANVAAIRRELRNVRPSPNDAPADSPGGPPP